MHRLIIRGTIWFKRVLPYYLLIITLLATPLNNSVAAIAEEPVAQAQSTSSAIRNISDNLNSYASGKIPAFQKLEITFQVDTSASNLQMPYDANPPSGVQRGVGISVDALFTPDNWTTVYTQPAFYYQDYQDEVKSGREWFYPTGKDAWKVRFAPNQPGNWQYKIRARDASGTAESSVFSFTAGVAVTKGPIRVSSRDSRYFEYSDGTYFPAQGYNMNYNDVSWVNPVLGNQENFSKMSQNGIQLVRLWLSQWSIWGSTWNPWQSIDPGLHGQYLPYTGLVNDQAYGNSQVSMELDASYNPCMFIGFVQAAPAVKANTSYRVRVRYRTIDLLGPKVAGKPFGLTAKVGGWLSGDAGQNCQDPGAGTVVTPYQPQNTSDWQILQGNMNSGSNNFLPYFYLVLENTNAGRALIDYVWIEEDLGNGQYGPNIVSKPWMAHHQYFDQRNSYAFDKVVNLAENNGIYLRPVIMEKNDWLFNHFDFNGNPIADDQRCTDSDTANDPAECPGNEWFYGDWQNVTMVRWYQQAWWRYLQARWGYSSNIQSWELLNEGDPFSGTHYTLANEFGKYMDQFKPNDHLVSTSFWHSFPKNEFWTNKDYSSVDFADVHQYISQGDALFNDTALATYQLSMQLGAKQSGGAGKPVIRGETGFTETASEPPTTRFDADTQGIWLHKFIWAGINPGGLIESNWYEDYHIYRVSNGTYQFDHRPIFSGYYNFIKDIPLSNGNYVDAAAESSNANLIAWGQKDLQNGSAHLWINNKQHTWKVVVDKTAVSAQSGTIKLTGFQPGSAYALQWWDTYQTDPAKQITRTESLVAQSDGSLIIAVQNLSTDTAVRISRSGEAGPTPTSGAPIPTSVSPTVSPTTAAATATATLPAPASSDEVIDPADVGTLPAGTNVLLDFDNIGNSTDGRALNNYAGISWNNLVEGSPWAGISTWNFYIASNGSEGTITFPQPVIVKSLVVSSQAGNIFTLSSAGNAEISANVSNGIPQTVNTNWTSPVTSLTIRAGNTDQAIDDLRFSVSGSQAGRTATQPAATATNAPTLAVPTATQPPVSATAVPTTIPTTIPPTPIAGEVVDPDSIDTLPAGTSVLLDFNNIPNSAGSQPLDHYAGLTWNNLVQGEPRAGVNTWNFFITNNGSVGSVTFPRPVVIQSLLVSTLSNNTYTLSSPGNPDVSINVSKRNPQTLTTSWKNPVTSLTIRASRKDQVLDDLRFSLSSAEQSPTPTKGADTAPTATAVAPTAAPPTASPTQPAPTATQIPTMVVPTATQVPAQPTATATPLPTQSDAMATPVATEVVDPDNIDSLAIGTKVLLDFNNIANPMDGRSLDTYSGLTWNNLVEGSPWAGIDSWNFYVSNNGTQGSVAFPRPVILQSLVVSSTGNNVFTLSSEGNPEVNVTVSGSPQTVTTNWTNPITGLTILAASSGQALDDLRFTVSSFDANPVRTPDSDSVYTPTPTISAATPTSPVSTSTSVAPTPVENSEPNAWPMAGANPQRTSWSPEEVSGRLSPVWYRPIEAYIPPQAQIVAANSMIYVSTSNGLYALDAETGALKWTYATELPLGNAPTIYNGVAYVGGYDHKLHAVNALTGQLLWTYSGAAAGFATNPLVANNMVYLGSRDGYFYAIYSNDHPNKGQLAWKYNAGNPILFSAAIDKTNGTLYFATDNAFGIALNALSGAQVWRSAKLPGAGFRSWWPVVYQDKVIFVGSTPYRTAPPFGAGDKDLQNLDGADYFMSGRVTPPEIGPRSGMQLNGTSLSKYLSDYPHRRTYFVLDAATGKETTYDFDKDGKADYAPVAWFGTRSGTRYPPIVAGRMPEGTDTRLIYQSNTYFTDGGFMTRGQVSGWIMGSPNIVTPRSGTNVSSTNTTNASDEPIAYSSGGDVIYWNLCCDRESGAFTVDGANNWQYWSYNLDSLAPGYDVMYWGKAESGLNKLYGTYNGVYGEHGDNNAPVPYNGKVYMIRSNAVIAMGTSGGSSDHSLIRKPGTANPSGISLSTAQLQQMLIKEVDKIIAAGHLRPGFGFSGNADGMLNKGIGDGFQDYWHNTADTLIVLSQAMPYLSAEQQQRLKTYLTNEINQYPPYQYAHNGWNQGAARESYILPPEITTAMSNAGPTDFIEFSGWDWPPYIFYGLWKYAQLNPDQAVTLFNASRGRLQSPNTAAFTEMPYLHNAWIAGYIGYVELAKLAGNTTEASSKQITLDQLMASRAANFNKDISSTSDTANDYSHVLSVARNFMYMTPELGQYLNDHALSKVQGAMQEYNRIAPYWFVSKFGATYAEGALQPLYDVNALFQAKALVLQEPRSELVKYLDVPAVEIGDLFYIQNLVSALAAP